MFNNQDFENCLTIKIFENSVSNDIFENSYSIQDLKNVIVVFKTQDLKKNVIVIFKTQDVENCYSVQDFRICLTIRYFKNSYST